MVQPDGTSRISKIDTYLNVAEAFAYRSTCLKRKYGAVIVKDDVVVSTCRGYLRIYFLLPGRSFRMPECDHGGYLHRFLV